MIGSPIAHSLSPAMHNAAYAQLGAPITYTALEVREGDAADCAATLRSHVARWRGLSVTMPLKAAMMAQVDRFDETARRVGVLNTIVCESDGGLRGLNTDVMGIVNALRFAHCDSGRSISAHVLGAGSTARAALLALAQLGVRQVTIHVRDPAKVTTLRPLAEQLDLTIRAVPLGDPLPRELTISTLPAYAADSVVLADVIDRDDAPWHLLDVAYSPWPSLLATRADSLGAKVVSGKEMLLYQAVEQVRLFAQPWLQNPQAPICESVVNVMCDSIGVPRRA